jgi:hypothetical protein
VAEVTVAVGGVRIGFAAREPDVAAAVADRYADFLSPGPTDWRFEARRREEGLVPLTDVVVREGDRGRLTIERHDFLATLDPAARAGTVALGAVDHVAVDAFLRVVCSLALLDVEALLVHAASLGRGGVARAFVGPSGSGKTTLARLSPDATLLSDEIAVLRLSRDGARCHGSPFWGELARAGPNAELPLAAIHFLRHAERHAATPAPPRAALAALLPNVLFFFAGAPALAARVLDVAAALVARVPCFALAFRPDPSVWEAIERAA